MDRNLQKNGVLNLLLLLAVGVATFAVARYCRSGAGQVATMFLGLGFLVALVSWFQMRLEDRERLEKMEFDELARGGASSSTLFNTQESEAFPARRAREQFEKFFVPAFTFLLLVAQAAAMVWVWKQLATVKEAPPLQQPLVAMSILGLLAMLLFVIGQFSSRLARLERQRLLQPASSYLLLGAYLLALVTAAIAGVESGVRGLDLLLSRGFCILLGLLALEHLLTLMLEVYRPRLKGKVVRLLYDSRLVGLISHPEGIFTTVAHTLDYQFGFKVSETWFYQFLRRSVAWLALSYLIILAGSTCLVYVQPGEQALLERFGNPVAGRELLEPGFHLKLPWPIDQAFRYDTQAIQSFDVGFEHDEKEEESAVLWTVSHLKQEFNLLVATRETNAPSPAPPTSTSTSISTATNQVAGKKAPPVSLLAVGIPVQFQIHDLKAWAYNYTDAAELLKQVAEREVVRYLVSIDVNEIMSTARFTAGEELRRRIQARADELKLGAAILFVGLQDIHPPVQVGAAYEEYVGVSQRRERDVMLAQAYAITNRSHALAEASRRVLTARAESSRKVAAAEAIPSLFTNQVVAFRSAPTVYAERARLQTLARNATGVRKFVRILTNSPENLMLNTEEKVRSDLLNIPLPPAKTP